MLHLCELFSSVQGETSLSGLPTTFIRLSGCSLRCRWCDTPYAFSQGEEWTEESLIKETRARGCRYVCVTGGEPLLQPGTPHLLNALVREGFVVSLETSGAHSIAEVDRGVRVILDVKCPGSGMEDRNTWSNLWQLRPHDEVKFVLSDRADYDYAKRICSDYHLYDRAQEVLLAPVYEQLEAKELVRWMLEDRLPVRLNFPLHKAIWSPTARGV